MMIRVKPVLGITIFFFIEFLVIFSAPVYIQGTENKIESLIKFEKTVTVKDMAAVGEPMDKQCKTAEESKNPDKINPCRDDAQKNAIAKLEKIALNRVFDSLKQDGFLEEKFLKELGMTEQDIRSESNFEAKTSEKEVIETKSYRCTLQGIVKVKISASFKEKLLKLADKSKYNAKAEKTDKPEDHTKQTVSKASDAVKQESSDISRSDYTEPKTKMEFVFVKGGDFEWVAIKCVLMILYGKI
ncbi:MAG: hypothetical protein HC887_04625 [Desulfobacteraceae bacterium]|nr:hypothetical protein [Desulfobacteraceae bacterium]